MKQHLKSKSRDRISEKQQRINAVLVIFILRGFWHKKQILHKRSINDHMKIPKRHFRVFPLILMGMDHVD